MPSSYYARVHKPNKAHELDDMGSTLLSMDLCWLDIPHDEWQMVVGHQQLISKFGPFKFGLIRLASTIALHY
jgi:hypothetical protein